MNHVFRISLLLALLLVTSALLAPYSAIARVHEQFGWIARLETWLTSVVPGLDLDHLAAFAALGFLAPLAGVRPRFGTAALALLGFAVLTELAQGLVPGRSPQVSDLVLDVLGGGMGYLVGYGMVGGSALTPALSQREREKYREETV